MDLELRHLRVLCAIADTGSVGRAAATIGASQPATSTQLRRIERHLGASVFDRTASGVVPTTFGAEVLAAAREVLARVDRLAQGPACAGDDHPHRDLRVAATSPALLPGLLTRARQLRPDLRFTLSPHLPPAPSPGAPQPAQPDLVLALDHPGAQLRPSPDFGLRGIATEPAFVALPAVHPLRHHAELTLPDLAAEAWLLPTLDGPTWPALFRAACTAASFAPAQVNEVRCGRRELLDLVAAGLGVALVPASTAPAYGAVLKPLLGSPLWLRHALLWRRTAVSPALADTLVAAATAAHRDLAAEAPHLHSWAARSFRPPRP
ncbi:LysR family transcriptional regulator [Kitasatospora sp. NPDC049285]|uniref:LysR family transcriptional regulator n=1 Tax=Kitasatospora sp. NPDC049285 TaxID=3157096 RepID=UPI0034405F82